MLHLGNIPILIWITSYLYLKYLAYAISPENFPSKSYKGATFNPTKYPSELDILPALYRTWSHINQTTGSFSPNVLFERPEKRTNMLYSCKHSSSS